MLVPGTGLVLNDRLANLRTRQGPPTRWPAGSAPCTRCTAGSRISRTGGDVGRHAGRPRQSKPTCSPPRVIDDGLGLADAVGRPGGSTASRAVPPTTTTLYVEWDFDGSAAAELARMGHRVETSSPDADDHFGACTVVEHTATTCSAVADHRRDCAAVAW